MKLRPFGSTNLRMSTMGLGLAALGRPGYINLGHGEDLRREYQPEAMEAHAHDVLDAAWEAGLRYFDVARSYGRAEEFLHSWLHKNQIAPASVTVGSKWGYVYTADWQVKAGEHEVKNHSVELLQKQWLETQSKLGAYCKLYQIHSTTFETGVLEDLDVLEELGRMRDEGVTIGLTVTGPNQAQILETALDVAVDGLPLFDSVQATWNLLERSAEPMLRRAHDLGMGVIIKEVLANGRLTSRNDAGDFAAQKKVLDGEARRLDTTLDALAIAAAMAHPWTDVILSGAARVEHLHSNLKACDVDFDEEAERRLRDLTEEPESYWKTRGELPWN
ncbi:MAG: aldo/keto reductase [Bradymonadaceae bacterium]